MSFNSNTGSIHRQGTTNPHTSLSLIRRGFAPGFVYLKKWCNRLAAVSDKVYRLLAHGRWFSPGTPASSTTKTGCHDIAEILLKVALSTTNQSINQSFVCPYLSRDYSYRPLVKPFIKKRLKMGNENPYIEKGQTTM